MKQQTLTLVAKVRDEARLREVLAEINRSRVQLGTRDQPELFSDPKLGIHFARIVYIPPEKRFEGWVALESNFDAETDDAKRAREGHLEALVRTQTEGMRALFACCEGFPADASMGALYAFCRRSLVDSTITYQGHASRSLPRIRMEQHLRDVILDFVHTARDPGPKLEFFGRIRDHVRARALEDERLSGLDVDAPPPSSPNPKVRKDKLENGMFPYTHAAHVALIYTRLPNLLKWCHEDTVYDLREVQEKWTDEDRRSFSDLAATEDYAIQNALTHVVPVRSGAGRLAVLEHAHAYIEEMSHKHFVEVGCLGGIPTIHFAKWLLIDGGKRLLFFSNYDHSWESYLGDFVDDAALGLNLAWSCTEQYPRTTCLFKEGAKDEETFKAWGRAYQRPTQVFYSAYPDLAIAGINNNTWIRHGIHQDPGNLDLDTWFRRLT